MCAGAGRAGTLARGVRAPDPTAGCFAITLLHIRPNRGLNHRALGRRGVEAERWRRCDRLLAAKRRMGRKNHPTSRDIPHDGSTRKACRFRGAREISLRPVTTVLKWWKVGRAYK